VVWTEIEFFLFPAFAFVSTQTQNKYQGKEIQKIVSAQKFLIILIAIFTLFLVIQIANYWRADILYAKAKSYNSLQKPELAIPLLSKAIKLEPFEAIYHNEASNSYTLVALMANEQKNLAKTQENINLALAESQKAVELSNANLNIKRSRFGMFLRLSSIDARFLILARDTLVEAISRAPTDAKLYYNLGLIQVRTGQADEAVKTMEKTITLKPNYKEARLAYAYLLKDKKEYQKARDQLNYILSNIDPNDLLTKQALMEIK
jgi:tetratricopeptide (TPR) repeat protein